MAVTAILIFALALSLLRADSSAASFTGHYELADSKADYAFSLDVTQTANTATISFSAGMVDGSGAAPDADGTGAVDPTGALAFTFKDSFDNEGTGKLVKAKDGYHLNLNATKVSEPRCLRFYGDILLRKTADKPAAN